MSHETTAFAALVVARYHRRAIPKKKHKRYKRLDKQSRRMVRQLSAMLRLADNLDRTHVQNTRQLDVHIGRDNVHVTIATRHDPELELLAAERAAEHFELAFGQPLKVAAAWTP